MKEIICPECGFNVKEVPNFYREYSEDTESIHPTGKFLCTNCGADITIIKMMQFKDSIEKELKGNQNDN